GTRGEISVIYIHFVWYEKVEEIYGWQRLDDVLETSAEAVREFYEREQPAGENLLLVAHASDDDFIVFAEIPGGPEPSEQRIRSFSERLGEAIHSRVRGNHGEDVAELCTIYVGAATA